MGRGLIGDGIGPEARVVELWKLDRGVAFVADRDGLTRCARSFDFAQRIFARINQTVEIAQVAPALQAGAIDVDDQADAAVHRDRQRLRAAHSADAGRQRDAGLERAAEVPARQLGKRLVRSLDDALRSDVNPRTRRHLPVHR